MKIDPNKLKAVLMDLAAEIASVKHPSSGDKWFAETAAAIKDIDEDGMQQY